MARSAFALSLLALVQICYAFPDSPPAPTPTDAPTKLEDGFTPKPTEPPHHELVRRISGLPRTCGWGQSDLATCYLGTCAFYSTGSTTLQGCCYSGTSSCAFPTTCYDYSQLVSSKCDSSCQALNLNTVCSRTYSGYCQSFTYPNGASGYGCGTDSASTWTSVATVTTSIQATWTAIASFAPDAAFYTTRSNIIPYRAYSSYTYSYPTYTPYSGGSSGSSYSDIDASLGSLAIGSIVAIAVFCVGYGCWYFAALIIVIMMCRRSKRLMAAWDQPGGWRNPIVAVPPSTSGTMMTGSNVVSPAGYYSQPGQLAPQQQGFYADGAKGISPPMQSVSPVGPSPASPAPTYSTQPFVGSNNTGSPYGTPVSNPAQTAGYHGSPQVTGQQPVGHRGEHHGPVEMGG